MPAGPISRYREPFLYLVERSINNNTLTVHINITYKFFVTTKQITFLIELYGDVNATHGPQHRELLVMLLLGGPVIIV